MPQTVLVAEDNQQVRQAFAEVLREHGYAVIEAANGAQAVLLARASRPHLILMDLSMPELNGTDAAAALKRSPETAGIPIVAVTARRYDERGHEFDGYLAKPITLSRLLRVVRTYLTPVAA
jgi:CheY-like chemotaxis protein